MTHDEIQALRAMAKSERWESEVSDAPAYMSIALTKATVLRLLALAEDHAKLLQQFSHLKEGVLTACDPECSGCGAWWVARKCERK